MSAAMEAEKMTSNTAMTTPDVKMGMALAVFDWVGVELVTQDLRALCSEAPEPLAPGDYSDRI
jgi:hypothetical protein